MTTNPQTITVTLSGPHGSGKTLLIRKITKFLENEGVKLLPITSKMNDQHTFMVQMTDADRKRLGQGR